MINILAKSPSRSLAVICLAFIAGLVLAYALGWIKADQNGRAEPLLFPSFSIALRASIERTLPEPHAGFLSGLLTGGTSQLSPEFRSAVLSTGTMHLLALSGWNISIIARGISSVCRTLPFRRRARSVLTISAITVFVLMVGLTPSVLRAALMGAAIIAAELLCRPSSAGRALLITASVMLLAHPALIADLSFLLSFFATLGLVYLSPIIKPTLKFVPKDFKLQENAISSVAATLATAPLILLTFGRLSLVSLPANMLLLPIIPWTMAVGFVDAFFGLICAPLGMVLGRVSAFFLDYCVSVIRLLARIPGSSVNGLAFNLSAALLMIAGMAAAVVLYHVKRKRQLKI